MYESTLALDPISVRVFIKMSNRASVQTPVENVQTPAEYKREMKAKAKAAAGSSGA